MVVVVLLVVALLAMAVLSVHLFMQAITRPFQITGFQTTGLAAIAAVAFTIIATVFFAVSPVRRWGDRRMISEHARLTGVLNLINSVEDPVVFDAIRHLIRSDVDEVNSHIRFAKDYNDSVVDVWIVDELAALELIE